MRHLIGSGAYGDVWLACNSIGTLRAVKVVWRASFSSDRPYEREFSGMLKFEPVSRSHEGFVDILQVGQGPGYFYYVMELADNAAVPGQPYRPRTLSAEARAAGRLPATACQRHFLMLSDALAALHRAGLIHRDIKPSNIILVGGVAKLADIGLVAAMDSERSFVGTEGFIPPEGPGSAPADIYSLGKVLYEVATGKDRMEFPSLPYDAATGRTDDELLEINAIFTKACAMEVRDRYATALEMHAELALLQSGRSVKKFRVLEERLRWARQAGAVTGVLALLAVGGFLVAGSRARLARENSERLEKALNRATTAEQAGREQLYHALAATAVAERRSGLFGQRFASLAAIISAAEIRPGAPELRDAAITTLAVPDLRETHRWPLPEGYSRQCFNHDQTVLFRAATNGIIHAVRATDGAELYQLGEPGDRVDNLEISGGDGRWLVVWRSLHGYTFWDLKEQRMVRDLPGSRGGVVSPDGHWLVENTGTNGLRLHDLLAATSRDLPCATIITTVLAGPAGEFLVAAKDEDFVELREFATGAIRRRICLPENQCVYVCQLDPDGRTLVVTTRGGRLLIWDLEQPAAPRAMLQAHSHTIPFCQFHPDGDWCLTSSWDGTTRLVGVSEGRLFSLGRHEFGNGRFSPDGTQFVSRDASGVELHQYEVAGRAICRVLGEAQPVEGNEPGPWNAAFLADGRLLAAASYEGVRIYDTLRGRSVAHLASTNWFAVCPAGSNVLWAAGPEGLARWPLVWKGAGEVQIGAMEMVSRSFHFHVQASADGAVVAAAGLGGFSLVLDGARQTNFAHGGGIRGLTLSRDGRRMATVGAANSLRIWSTADGTVIRQIPQSANGGEAISPDGARVLCNGPEVILRSIDTGEEIWRTALPGAGSLVVWSPDGRLACVLRDGMVPVLLNAANGEVLGRFEHPDFVPYASFVFSPSGDQLACVSTAHVIHLWNLRPLRRELAALKLDWNLPPMPELLVSPLPLRVKTAASLP